MVRNKRYSKDFKLEAARLVVEHGYTFKEAAKRLGTTDGSIRQWVQKFRQDGDLPPPADPQINPPPLLSHPIENLD